MTPGHPASLPEPSRWHALDAVRGLAMLLGIVLHAAVAYMPHEMPDLLWATRDSSTHPIFDWIFWAIHGFRLPIFFVLAGFFSVVLCDSRGVGGYLIHRTRRLLLPLLVAAMVVLPVVFAVWVVGWLDAGLCTLREVRRMRFQPELQRNLYGPVHLWFLMYLYPMCLLFAVVRALLDRLFPQSRMRIWNWLDRLVASRWCPVLGVIPSLILAFEPAAIYNFHNTFVPEVWRLGYYGLFFCFGTLLARQRSSLNRCLIPAAVPRLVLSVACLGINGLLLQNFVEGQAGFLSRLSLGISGGLLASFATLGSLGLALRLCQRESPQLRFLAESAFWIYLIHLPIVGIMQIALRGVAIPTGVKFVVVCLVTLVIGVWSYRKVVQGTVVGTLLNGSRTPRARTSTHPEVGRAA